MQQQLFSDPLFINQIAGKQIVRVHISLSIAFRCRRIFRFRKGEEIAKNTIPEYIQIINFNEGKSRSPDASNYPLYALLNRIKGHDRILSSCVVFSFLPSPWTDHNKSTIRRSTKFNHGGRLWHATALRNAHFSFAPLWICGKKGTFGLLPKGSKIMRAETKFKERFPFLSIVPNVAVDTWLVSICGC